MNTFHANFAGDWLNARYHSALRLAGLVLRVTSTASRSTW